jgi:hypothetical protein
MWPSALLSFLPLITSVLQRRSYKAAEIYILSLIVSVSGSANVLVSTDINLFIKLLGNVC